MTKAEPPPGGDQDTGYILIITVTATFVPALLAVCLRMYTRSRIARSMGWDDWIMLPAIIAAFLASATEIVAAKRGLGRHGFYLTTAQKAEAGKYADLGQFFCITSLSIGKISMCISLLRVISGSNKKYLRYFLNFMIFLQFAINVITVTVELVQCRPTRKVWASTVPGTCWSPKVYTDFRYLQAALSCATDYLLAGLPIYILKDLKINRRDKILLCILMGFGSVTGIFAIIRCVYLAPYANENDSTWTNIRSLTWGGVERNTGILVACIPFLRPILHTPFMKSVFSLTSRTSNSRSYRRSGYSVHSDTNYELSNKVNNVNTRNSERSNVSIIDHTASDIKVSNDILPI